MQKRITTMADFSAEITGLGDQIANLKVSQAVELGNYLEQKYGIKAAAGAVVAAPTSSAPAAAAPVEAQTEFTVTLDGLADPAKKIQVIKVVRELTSQGLAEAKATVEGAPKPIKEGVDKKTADEIKKKLEEAGGKASVK
jgi:large subunit ribosomal protein L7/L12